MKRVCHRLLRRVHQCGDGTVEQYHHKGKYNPRHREEINRRADGGSHLPVVFRPRSHRYQDGSPRGQPEDDTRNGLHHLAADGDARYAGSIVILSHHEQVCTAIQRLKHVGDKKRHREPQQHLRNASLCQIQFFHTQICVYVYMKKAG